MSRTAAVCALRILMQSGISRAHSVSLCSINKISSRLTASFFSTRSSTVKSVKVDPFGVSDMIKFLLTFGAGVYTGIYITQNYDVPRVDEPAKLWEKTSEKVKDLLDQHKKP